MPPRNLLLCFDAFGTLFKPRQPVPQQYADVARKFGLAGFSNADADVAASFKTAFKQESQQNPNYGKANGMNPEKWWTNVINNTFKPFIGQDTRLPSDIVPELLQRFWCDKGYTLFPDVQPLIQGLREAHKADNAQVVVGVITNSDDRVPDILSSLGMRVGSLRYGSPAKPSGSEENYDIDFTITSYDVGHEKPDKRIFAAAEEALITAVEGQGSPLDAKEWRKVYIGDDYGKDVVGAVEAGWNAVLIDRETTRGRKDVDWLDPKEPGDLEQVFKLSKAVGFGSLAKLAEWLSPKS